MRLRLRRAWWSAALILFGLGCGAAPRDPSSATPAPTHLRLPNLAHALSLPPIPTTAPSALVEEALAVEQLLSERAPTFIIGGSREETQRALIALFTWYTDRAPSLPRPWPDACRGCSAREGAYFVAIGAVAHDHLLGQFVSPSLARADGGAVTDPVRRDVWSLLARGVPETAIGDALLALDRCQSQARGLEGLERIAATCNIAELRWTAVHQRRSQTSEGSERVDTDAPPGPRECWTTPERSERPSTSTGPPTPPAVVVTFGESSTMLDEAERRAVRGRVAAWARTHVLPAVGGTLVTDDVQVEWERLGRVGRVATAPACAHGTVGLESLDDAAPVVLALVIDAGCGDTTCSLRVTPTLSVGALPEALRVSFRADVARTEAVQMERWVAAVDALQQEPRLGGILVSSPAMTRAFDAWVEALIPNDSLRDAVQSTTAAHASIGACVTDLRRRVIRATVRWDERGGVEDVAIAPWTEASERERVCIATALLTLPRIEGVSAPSRATLALSFRGTDEQAAVDPRSRYGQRAGAYRIHMRSFRADDARLDGYTAWSLSRDHTRDAMARCLAELGVEDAEYRRVVVELVIDGSGHPTEAHASESSPELGACMEREMRSLALPCPAGRAPSRVRVDACGGRERAPTPAP